MSRHSGKWLLAPPRESDKVVLRALAGAFDGIEFILTILSLHHALMSSGKINFSNVDSIMEISKFGLLPRHITAEDAYVTIRPFETGGMVTPAATLIGDTQGSSMATSWRFFIEHPRTNTKLWFDMGISHVWRSNPYCFCVG